ncbi:alpha/beta fold hydrolase [Actinomadura sediminis]|uniref:Alpha/beta fold hydrolase n=1 Tax=Actinomadura sediminis TaxID=1038904 RepID=A0ABW3EIS7_9ACTN
MKRLASFGRNGLIFNVVDQGPPDGDIAVLLHGFPQTSSSWEALAPHLHAEGYRTLAPDQRGYSPGARPRGRYAYRMSELVNDVLALIATAAPDARRVHVIGHDWGAAVAWALAAAHPNVLSTLTALSAPHPAAFIRSLFTSRQFLMSWYMYFFQLPWIPELALRRLYRSRDFGIATRFAAGRPEANTLRDVTFLMTSGALTPALNWYRAMPFNPPGRLAPVTVPTLFIAGDADPALGPEGAALTRDHVTGPYTFHTLRGVGHWIPEQAAPEVAALLEPHLSR